MGEELSKHTLNLYPGDYEELRSLYPDIGAGVIIRKLVRSYLEQVKVEGVSVNTQVEIRL